MKIKILKSCSGYRFSFRQGDTVEVEDYIGNDLVGCGFAEAVKAAAKQKTANAAAAKKKTAKADAKKETANAAAEAEDADA